jgi:hypothetical protein
MEQGGDTADVSVRIIEIATEADQAYVAARGGPLAANAAAMNTFNMVEGVYQAELAMRFMINYQHTWSDPDPYTAGDLSNMLTQFRTHWNTAFTSVARDYAHLFVGVPGLSGGIAYHSTSQNGVVTYGVLCRVPSLGYGITANFFTEAQHFVGVAHELGHTLSAGHREAGEGCGQTIMNAVVGEPVLSFCEASRQDIRSYVAAHGSCFATGCAPTTCQAQGASCGSIPDGCGGTLECGACSGGQTCGGGGTPNQCGSAAPAPFDVEYWGQAGDVPFAGNFYGDATADLAIFRPGDPLWYVRHRGNFDASDPQYFGWGYASDQTVILHFAGGPDLISQWRDSDGYWYTLEVGVGPVQYRQFGQSGDMPVSGNLRGIGTDLAVYRPSNGVLYMIDYAGTSYTSIAVGSIPAERLFGGDFLGTGRDQVAFYSGGTWTIVDGVTGERQAYGWGQPGDQPFVGRLLSASRTTMAVFRPGDSNVYLLEAGGGSAAFQYGQPGDVPLAGDFRARGKDDLVQWRPSTGQWFIYNGL